MVAVLFLVLSGNAAAVPTRGELKVLVVLAGFADRPLAHPREYFAGAPAALIDRFVAYYDEVSAGRLHIIPYVGRPVVTLPGRRADYVQRPSEIARRALEAFAAEASAPADRSALASSDALLVFFAGPGRESHSQGGDPDDPWSNYTGVTPPAVAEGSRVFDEACVIAEEEVAPFSNFGVLCHEFGHLLGLPELYAPSGSAHEGIGIWGLMGQGTWLGKGEHPPHLEAWSKLHLGWVDADTISETKLGLLLPAVEREPRVIKIPVSAARPFEYYLLENRMRLGADSDLPGEGLLVWHVDESVTGGMRGLQARAEHKLLHLVEADGRGDLDRGHTNGGNRGDATDPWSGPPRRQSVLARGLLFAGALLVALAALRMARPRPVIAALLRLAVAVVALAGGALLARGPACSPDTPGMAPYDGSPGRVTITGLSPAGPAMRLDALVRP